MRAWSFGLGRWFGVELRVHASLLLLLGFAMSAPSLSGGSGGRGVALWGTLVFAITVREVARAMAAAWLGLALRSLLVLPTGALATYAGETTAALEWKLGWVGPAANLLAGAVLGALLLSTAPELDLVHLPWIGAGHLLRTLVWMNLLLGALHLLPGAPLDAGRVLRAALVKRSGAQGSARATATVTQMISLVISLAGLRLGSVPLLLTGAAVLLATLVERPAHAAEGAAGSVQMHEVMLVDFTTLSASDTLEEALERAIHVSQDVFPVVRGSNIVGAISRQGIVEALATEGNGYVQGLMTRTLAVAYPEELLVKVLGRMPGTGAQILPVVDGERVLGIVTPQHLAGSMRLVNQRRRWRRAEERAKR